MPSYQDLVNDLAGYAFDAKDADGNPAFLRPEHPVNGGRSVFVNGIKSDIVNSSGYFQGYRAQDIDPKEIETILETIGGTGQFVDIDLGSVARQFLEELKKPDSTYSARYGIADKTKIPTVRRDDFIERLKGNYDLDPGEADKLADQLPVEMPKDFPLAECVRGILGGDYSYGVEDAIEDFEDGNFSDLLKVQSANVQSNDSLYNNLSPDPVRLLIS